MSKKILKRSLALGALMAFVITGSAMAMVASDFTDNEKYNSTTDGVLLKNITTDNAYVISPSTNGIRIGVVYTNADVGNHDYDVSFGKLKIESICNGIYLQSGAGENTITAKEIDLVQFSQMLIIQY